jgi:hypothetical protein
MGARMDKTNSQVGVVRAYLAADIASTEWNRLRAVGLNSSGKVVLGAGNNGIKGIAVFDRTNSKAGMPVDIFKLGELILNTTGQNDLLVAATNYTANTTTGVVSSAAASGTQIAVGYTVTTDRFILQGLG